MMCHDVPMGTGDSQEMGTPDWKKALGSLVSTHSFATIATRDLRKESELLTDELHMVVQHRVAALPHPVIISS